MAAPQQVTPHRIHATQSVAAYPRLADSLLAAAAAGVPAACCTQELVLCSSLLVAATTAAAAAVGNVWATRAAAQFAVAVEAAPAALMRELRLARSPFNRRPLASAIRTLLSAWRPGRVGAAGPWGQHFVVEEGAAAAGGSSPMGWAPSRRGAEREGELMVAVVAVLGETPWMEGIAGSAPPSAETGRRAP
eukprot:1137288-Pelagomonas_calceolata.AAC.2